MKAHSAELLALLESGDFVYADILTVMLNGGEVIRWSLADAPISWAGNTFALGPTIERSAISQKIGLEVATLTLNIDAGGEDQVNGTPLIRFVAQRGLDGANVKLERAFMPDWRSAVTGTVISFAGRITSVGEIKASHAEVTVSSWLVLLNVNMPPNLYQVGCLHTVYDSGCGLNPESFAATGTVSSGTQLAFASNLTGATGLYSQGRLVFLTGANAGISRAVKSNDGTGGFQMLQPLPAVPASGDTFRAYAGCDLTQGTCSARFNNLGRFKATPFVPVPETVT